MDAVAAVGAAFDDSVQEDDLVFPFADGDVEVSHGFEAVGQIGQFVVVGGEEGAAVGRRGRCVRRWPRRGDRPSSVLVPRPISSRMTRLWSVALLRMLAVSVISTMKVDWPPWISSLAPMRVKRRSAMPMRGALGGDVAADLGEEGDEGDLADVGGFCRPCWGR